MVWVGFFSDADGNTLPSTTYRFGTSCERQSEFNTDVRELTLAMISILRAGGLGRGGFNFDAKLRRQSIDPEDLFHAHIGGMDAYALAFKIARRVLADGKFEQFVAERYASYDSGFGREAPAQMIEDYTVIKTLLLRGMSVWGEGR